MHGTHHALPHYRTGRHLLSPSTAALALVHQTVAARLFGVELLSAHLAFCTRAAARVPVRELTYPHSLAALGSVEQAFAADLVSLSIAQGQSAARTNPATNES